MMNHRNTLAFALPAALIVTCSAGAGDCGLTATLIGENVDLATGITTNMSGVSCAFNTEDDEFLIVWFDSRNPGQNDVYAQRLSPFGDLLDENITVVAAENSQTDTSVAYNIAEHEYFIGWKNQGGPPGSGGFNHTLGRVISATGDPLTDPVDISNGGLEGTLAYNSVDNTYFLEARNFAGGGTGGIRGQRITIDGTPFGGGISIATAGAPAPAGQVAYNPNANQYLATWRDQTADDLKGRIVNANGTLATAPFQISPVFPTSGLSASVAFDPDNDRYLVVWGDFSTGPIRGQFVSPNGTLDGGNFIAVDTATNGSPFVAFDEIHGVFLVAWRNGGTLSARLLTQDGTQAGNPVTIATGTAYTHPRITADTNNGGFVVAWADNRNSGSGHNDTFAQIIGLTNPCAGDMDNDGDVDEFDFELFLDCVTGPDGGPLAPECTNADFDLDNDADFADFADFMLAFTG